MKSFYTEYQDQLLNFMNVRNTLCF